MRTRHSMRAEPVRQVVGDVGDLGGGLAGHEPDLDPVDVAGGGDLAEHRQDDPALIPRGQPGDRHHRRPPAPVPPRPPLAAGRDATQRANDTGHSTRQHTSTSTAQTARRVTPSQPVSAQ